MTEPTQTIKTVDDGSGCVIALAWIFFAVWALNRLFPLIERVVASCR